MLRIIGRHMYRLWYGDPEREAQYRAERAAQQAYREAHPWPTSLEDFPLARSKPYGGQPVPKEALFEGVEPDGGWLWDWHERWQIVLAKNGRDALVFSVLFVTELDTGEVIYDEDDRRAEDHPGNPGQRLAETIKIHERLEGGDSSERCKRVVKFLGSSPSCYRIENLLPNGSCHEISSSSQVPGKRLALHQRWALQYLSACRYTHEKGIVINAPADECTWIRSDLSLVVAGFVDASCSELGIRAGSWDDGFTAYSPFSPHEGDPQSQAYDYGQPRTDLFNWACWVYQLMTDGQNPFLPLTKEKAEVSRQEMMAREEAVQKGLFKHWPMLPNDHLGPCLIKAWKGEYESADDAFRDVKAMLEGCGRVFARDEDDEMEGFDWGAEFGPARQ